MFSLTEQFSAATRVQLETQFNILNALARKTFEGAQQVIALNLSTARASVDRSSAAARKLLEAKDTSELLSVAQAPNLDNVLAYSRELLSIASKTQAGMIASATQQMREAAAHPAVAIPAIAAPAVQRDAQAAPKPATAKPAMPEPGSAVLATAEPVVASDLSQHGAEAKADGKGKPATAPSPVAEAVARLADLPAAAPLEHPAAATIPDAAPVVVKSVEPAASAAPATKASTGPAAKPAVPKQIDQSRKSKK